MHKCLFCGFENPSEKAKFCVECGPEGPSSGWGANDIDQPEKIRVYLTGISEFYFDAGSGAEVEKFSKRMRERWKITHDTHSRILARLSKKKNEIKHFADFKLEFNENVLDSFAGHDTYLGFKYTNISEDEPFKVSLSLDSPDGTDHIDFRTNAKSFVQPGAELNIGANGIFQRMGMKEISGLLITITDRTQDSVVFRASSFAFSVGNPNQKITQNISTHNEISIEGRGVVDASGMGGERGGLADLRQVLLLDGGNCLAVCSLMLI